MHSAADKPDEPGVRRLTCQSQTEHIMSADALIADIQADIGLRHCVAIADI